MRRYRFTLLAGMALVLCAAFPSFSQQSAPAEDIKLAYFPEKVVIYKHSAHAEVDCKTCHHTWDGAATMQKCSDSGCHDSFDRQDKSERSLYNAIHGKGTATNSSCVQCHRIEAGKNPDKKKELTGCIDSYCHPKP